MAPSACVNLPPPPPAPPPRAPPPPSTPPAGRRWRLTGTLSEPLSHALAATAGAAGATALVVYEQRLKLEVKDLLEDRRGNAKRFG